jgi:hypothetical protein
MRRIITSCLTKSLSTAVWLAAFVAPAVVHAEQSLSAQILQTSLQGKVPPDWQVHVSARTGALFAFVTPPYQKAFDLWYEPATLRETMLRLCPGAKDPVWARIGSEVKIMIQPTVGGKSAIEMGVECPRDEQS